MKRFFSSSLRWRAGRAGPAMLDEATARRIEHEIAARGLWHAEVRLLGGDRGPRHRRIEVRAVARGRTGFAFELPAPPVAAAPAAGATERAPFRAQPGAIVDGRYRLEGLLGRGGMGSVHRAIHLALGDAVALKLLDPRLREAPGAYARFCREAQALSRLRSAHLARVLDLGEHRRQPYLVMDLVAGEPLSARLARGAPLPPALAVEIMRQLCEGLAVAHDAGIVHRDVKPENVLVDGPAGARLVVTLVDFGAARTLASSGRRLTHVGDVLGTPSYMAPEHLREARDADARSDIWSCGVVLHELLCGQRPGAGWPARGVLHGPLGAIVARCLACDPAERYPSARALAAALGAVGSAASRAPWPVAPALAPATARLPAPPGAELGFRREKMRDDEGRTAFEMHHPVLVFRAARRATTVRFVRGEADARPRALAALLNWLRGALRSAGASGGRR